MVHSIRAVQICHNENMDEIRAELEAKREASSALKALTWCALQWNRLMHHANR
jgi:hypothetical protein